MRYLVRLLALSIILSMVLLGCGAPPSQPVGAPADEQSAETGSTGSDEQSAETGSDEEATEPPAEEPTPAPTATTIVAEAGSGQTKLVFWNGLTGSDGETMVEIVEQFTEENPDVSVRVEMMQWSTYFDKLLTSLISGNPPDLFLLHEFEIPEFASQGVLGDTSRFFSSAGGPLQEEDFEPRVIEALDFEGGRYGVPIDVHGYGMWINRDLFEAAELDPEQVPQSAEEFIEVCQRLTIDAEGRHAGEEGFDPENVEQWGVVTGWMKPHYLTVLWQNGGDWIDEEGNAALDSEAARESLQFFHDLIYKHHCAPPPAGFDYNQAFASGNLAILPNGSWTLNFIQNNEVNYGVWEYPLIGDEPAVWTSSHVMYIPTNLEADRLDAAERLLTYIIEHTDTWATSGQPPASLSVRNSLTEEEYPSTVVFARSFERQGRYDNAHRCMSEIIDEGYMPEIDAALNNLKSVDQALQDADERIQSILDRCN